MQDNYVEDDGDESGWRIFAVTDKASLPKDDGRYHPHKWIEALQEITKYQWWWDIQQRQNYIRSRKNLFFRETLGIRWDGETAIITGKDFVTKGVSTVKINNVTVNYLINSDTSISAFPNRNFTDLEKNNAIIWVHLRQKLEDAEAELRSQIFKYNEQKWDLFNLVMALLDSISSDSEKRVIQHLLWGYKPVELAKKLNVSKPYVSRVTNKWLDEWKWNDEDIYKARILLLTNYISMQYYQQTLTIPKYNGKHPYNYLQDTLAIQAKVDFCKYVINSTHTNAYFSDLNIADSEAFCSICTRFLSVWMERTISPGFNTRLYEIQQTWRRRFG